MNSSEVRATHQSARTQSYKSGPINFSKHVFSESSPFSSGQHNGSIVFDKNGWTGNREMTALIKEIYRRRS